MAIPSATNRNDYVGTSAVHVYAYSFRILLESHLRVIVRDTLGNETTLALTTDYTVDGVRNANGGNVTLVNSGQAWLTAGELTTGFSLAIRRVLPLTQLTDFRNQGDFFPETHEDEFDRGVMVAQQQQDELGRSLKLPETEAGSAAATTIPLSADRANKFLAFDGSGNPIASAGVSDAPVSAFMETVVDDVSGSAALTTLRNNLFAETAPVADDELFLRDTSALTVDRIAISDFFKVIAQLTAETAPAIDDLVLLYDTSAATADKITLADLLKVINSLTEDTTPDVNADFFLSYDTSAAAVKKIKPINILPAVSTRQTFLSGSGTYMTPANARQLRIRMVGGGGGGAATTTNNGVTGVDSSFNAIVAAGGAGGIVAATPSVGGVGGSGGAGSASFRIPGGDGGPGNDPGGSATAAGGNGGSSAFGGAGSGGGDQDAGVAGKINSGSGGGGAGCNSNTSPSGGGAGEYVEIIINAPAATYAYTVGTGGAGGAAGTNAGGAGAAGIIIVDEVY